MNDPRLQPESLRHLGEPHRIAKTVCDLLDGEGRRQRQGIFGQAFRVLDRKGDRALGYLQRDGYLGWVDMSCLDAPQDPTHLVAQIRSYAKATPDLKTTEAMFDLSFGSGVTVTHREKEWAGFDHQGQTLYVPTGHLEPIGHQPTDPVSIAELFIGTPYVWGGNSAFGIDCSGLVQASAHACGIPCPGDSDLQAKAFRNTREVKRGTLLFWPGHVAIAISEHQLIHANAYHMSVTVNPIEETIDRIEGTGEGPLLSTTAF